MSTATDDPSRAPEEERTDGLEISLPPPGAGGRDQDEEYCDVSIDGERRRIRFHDYAEIYGIPGLYERLFYEELRCASPRTVREMLAGVIEEEQREPAELRVLDVGAGNGIVGEELNGIGAGSLTGVDIIPEAAEAAARDRPGLYDDYRVLDLTDVPEADDADLAGAGFNCLTTVAALGYDDIPPQAFAGGYGYLDEGGLLGLTIKAEFVDGDDSSGFADLIRGAVGEGAIELAEQREFTHRLSAAGEPIPYVAIVGHKRGELPEPGVAG